MNPRANPTAGERFSRAHFLRWAGAGIGASFVSGSLSLVGGVESGAQTAPGILSGGEYPIGIWWPPPPTRTSPRRYAEISEAGFNFVIGGNGLANDGANPEALEAAAASGLRFLLTDGRLRDAIQGTASRSADAERSQEGAATPSVMRYLLAQSETRPASRAISTASREAVRQRIGELRARYGGAPALAGLNLYDEPHRSLFGTLGFAKEEVLRRFSGGRLPYVNVWPSYASSSALGSPTYADYLRRYMEGVRPSVLCFDHYPLVGKNAVTPDFFYNWAVIRDLSLKFGARSWGFIQSVGFDGRQVGLEVRRQPDEREIFWQINVALAYGAKGLQYFTYWTPDSPPGAPIRFGPALITKGGQRTRLYAYARRANAYLRAVGRVLLPLASESVVHAGERRVPRGTRAFKPDAYVRSASGSPVVLSTFRKPGAPDERHLLVANRSFAGAAKTRLKMSSSVKRVYRLNTDTGGFVPLSLSGTPRRYLSMRLPAGEARLYRLRTG
jgi:hypothetical protein